MALTNLRPDPVSYSILTVLSLLSGMSCSSPAGDNSALYQAIYKADVSTVRNLLDQGANPNSNLIRRGILERPARYNSENPPTPLVAAIIENQPEIVKLLLAKGARAAFKDDAGFTPLEHAMSEGNPGIVGALLDNGADARAESKFGFPLVFAAACRGKDRALTLMLDKGAGVDTRDSTGSAGHHYVGSLESTYKRMLGRSALKARPDATLLMLAAQQGESRVVKLLIDRGADVNAKDSAGRSALMLVAEEGIGTPSSEHSYLAHLLLSSGTNLNVRDNNGDTVLMARKGLPA